MITLKKLFKLVALLAFSSLITNAQKKEDASLISAVLIKDGGSHINVLLLRASGSEIVYRQSLRSAAVKKIRLSDISGVFMFDPELYREAKSLFGGRKYEQALEKFIECQKEYEQFKGLDNNYADLSAFYILECYRKLEKYDELVAGANLLDMSKLTRPSMKLQVEVCKLWELVKSQKWSELDTTCKDLEVKVLASGLRVQVAYLRGLALDGLGKKVEALDAYAVALTADITRSDVVVRNAALNSLKIFSENAGVSEAISLWAKPDEDKNSKGYRALKEANALARLYDKLDLGSGLELPEKYKVFQKYTSEELLEQIKLRKEAAAKKNK